MLLLFLLVVLILLLLFLLSLSMSFGTFSRSVYICQSVPFLQATIQVPRTARRRCQLWWPHSHDYITLWKFKVCSAGTCRLSSYKLLVLSGVQYSDCDKGPRAICKLGLLEEISFFREMCRLARKSALFEVFWHHSQTSMYHLILQWSMVTCFMWPCHHPSINSAVYSVATTHPFWYLTYARTQFSI